MGYYNWKSNYTRLYPGAKCTIISDTQYKLPKPCRDMWIFTIPYVELCNPFRLIENPFSLFINSVPRNRQYYLICVLGDMSWWDIQIFKNSHEKIVISNRAIRSYGFVMCSPGLIILSLELDNPFSNLYTCTKMSL